MQERIGKLKGFFHENPEVAVAFSGGVDSSYLLYAARQTARRVKAYIVKSSFQPQFELDDALRLAKELNVDTEVIEVDVLSDQDVVSNPPRRCYYCKKRLFSAILEHAANDGFRLVLDGTNASDDAGDRPGMVALRELSVESPLRVSVTLTVAVLFGYFSGFPAQCLTALTEVSGRVLVSVQPETTGSCSR